MMENANHGAANEKKFYNFLINASNQANLVGSQKISPVQINTVLVLIDPYKLENLEFEGLDINVSTDENNIVRINNQPFEAIEIEPGVRVLGISKKEKG